MTKQYRVIELWANLENPNAGGHVKKDIGEPWTSELQAKKRLKELKVERPYMSFGIESNNNKGK